MIPSIIPDPDPRYDELKPSRLTWTYLHGQLETDCGYDCYGMINHNFPTHNDEPRRIDHSRIEDGKYAMEYKGKKCTLYFWHDDFERPQPHGLVVYDDDAESVAYAEECLIKKPTHI
jgi:hypothetical protein